MIGKMIVGMYNWYATRVKKNYEKTKMTEEQRKQLEFKKQMQGLYSFVQWMNRQFRNRRERKTFWRNVSEGQPALDNTIRNLMTQYGAITKEDKPKEKVEEIKLDDRIISDGEVLKEGK